MSFTPPTNRNKFVKVKTAKKRKTSSNDWLRRQLNDVYVTQAKIDGYRSRAAYKLLEIDNKFKIFRPNLKIIDLGSAPGSWCQVVTKTVKSAEITAIDLIQMEPIEGVHFICGDFLSPETNEIINNNLCGEKVDIVMSDMAANTTGHTDTDYIRTLVLYESALEFALKTLKPNGHFISKVFGGGTEHNILNIVKTNFKTIKHFKPNSSRKDSREFYLIALGYKGG